MKIPKIIHYCWYGNNRMNKLERNCLKSWKINLPEYEIKRWDESNTDFNHPFLKLALRQKKWAFIADFVRLRVLLKYGGIYLDTDMYVLKSLDPFLNQKCFLGAENADFLSCGIIGACPAHSFIEKSLASYDDLKLRENIIWRNITIPKIMTNVFIGEAPSEDQFDMIIKKDNIIVYPPRFFYSFPFEEKGNVKNFKDFIHEDSFAIHLWAGSWIEYNEFYLIRNRKYLKGFQAVLKKIIKKKGLKWEYFKKIGSSIKLSVLSKNKK